MPHFITNRLTRTAFIASSAAAAIAVIAPAASAHGFGGVGASCSGNQSGCTVTAQDPGGSTTGGAVGTGAGGSESGSSSSTSGSASSAPKCWDITPTQAQLSAFGPPTPPSGKGHWVLDVCEIGANGIGGLKPTLQWQADGKPALPDPVILAAQAESKLTLAKPTVDSSPAAGVKQVVQLPTWTWMPKAQWAPLSATAAVPGESVTATAAPVSLSFSWGDGTSSTCQGPGTPYVSGASDPSAPSPTCGHTYQVTSAAAPGQQFPVTATLAWQVTWAGGGQSGTFPDLTTTTTVHWTVEQVQSVLVQGGGA